MLTLLSSPSPTSFRPSTSLLRPLPPYVSKPPHRSFLLRGSLPSLDPPADFYPLPALAFPQFLEKNPEYKKALEIVQVPERIIQFRVVWEDDKGECHVQRGFRVQVRLQTPPSCPGGIDSLVLQMADGFPDSPVPHLPLCSTTLPSDPTREDSDSTPLSTSPSSSCELPSSIRSFFAFALN